MSLAAGRSTPRPTGRRWSSASWAEWGGRSAAPGLVPRLGLARVLVAREAQHALGDLLRLVLDVELGQALTGNRIGPVGHAVEERLPGILADAAQQRHGVEGDAGDGVALVCQGGPGAPPTFSDIPDPALVGHAHVGQVDLVELG